jgi:hypothetical protein
MAAAAGHPWAQLVLGKNGDNDWWLKSALAGNPEARYLILSTGRGKPWREKLVELTGKSELELWEEEIVETDPSTAGEQLRLIWSGSPEKQVSRRRVMDTTALAACVYEFHYSSFWKLGGFLEKYVQNLSVRYRSELWSSEDSEEEIRQLCRSCGLQKSKKLCFTNTQNRKTVSERNCKTCVTAKLKFDLAFVLIKMEEEKDKEHEHEEIIDLLFRFGYWIYWEIFQSSVWKSDATLRHFSYETSACYCFAIDSCQEAVFEFLLCVRKFLLKDVRLMIAKRVWNTRLSPAWLKAKK